ncbi:hypothetical protein GW17_00028190 [Ensete ventricosum]|nr:hypothetical protein GW17_00028190 [Ensete ventricosum]
MGAIDVTVALLLISNVIILRAFAVAGRKVIIVGAGMSGKIFSQFRLKSNRCMLFKPLMNMKAIYVGISAAKTLSDAGIKDILILEATDRIGGRMRKASFAGLKVEVGANWVEGVNGLEMNPIWEMANKLHLRQFISDFRNISSNTYKDNVPSTALEMVVDYFNYDYEFAEPPRVTSLQNTVPLPTFANFGKEAYFVADQRGFESLVYDLAAQFLRTAKNSSIVDPRLLLGKVNASQYSFLDRSVVSTLSCRASYTSQILMSSYRNKLFSYFN